MSRLTDDLINSVPWASTEERAEWWRNKCYEVFEELEHYRHLEEQGRLIEQKHGQWKSVDFNKIMCSECNHIWNIMNNEVENFKYCPNCGVKMDKVK